MTVEGHAPLERRTVSLQRAVAMPAVSYGLIAALQLRVIWGIWDFRDTTPGDTASYFLDAAGWAHGLHDNIVWSPLYTDFFGTVVAAVGDVPNAVLTHRLLIVFAASLLVLAVMRCLFSPAVALLVALWWTALPPNYNVEYEVHLFGMLPIFAALIVLSRVRGARGRGIALAILLGSTLLLRNELAIATVIFAILVIIAELRSRPRASGRRIASTYGLPLLVVVLLFGVAYARSTIQRSQLRDALAAKRELNMCQVYAFTYQQRHPDKFTGSPWTDCGPLMQRTFGDPMPTFERAFREDPGAVASYVGWNGRLLLSGLQVSLFGVSGTGDDPGFSPVRKHRAIAWVASGALLAVLTLGALIAARDWRHWRRLLHQQRWALAMLASVAVTTLFVALTERPRPEYLYGLTLMIMVLFGYVVEAIARRIDAISAVAVVSVAVAVGALFILGSRYHSGPRPLHDAIRHLQGVRTLLQQPGSTLLASGYNYEICSYLALDHVRHCDSPSWPTIESELATGNLRSVLRREGVTVVYVDPGLRQNAAIVGLATDPRKFGWRRFAEGIGADGQPWSVLVRRRPVQ